MASGSRLALRGGKGHEPDMVVRGAVNNEDTRYHYCQVEL